MKRVVSVSLGSRERNHKVNAVILGEEFLIERIGTDGSIPQMIDIIRKLDGQVDAFGLGGIDLYLFAGKTKYTIKEAEKIVKTAQKTPIVDGSGLKNTLERRTLNYLKDNGWDFKNKKVLMVCAMDRFGMAETFEEYEAKVVYGDLLFSLGLPIKIYSLKTLHFLAKILMPIVRLLPFKLLYPTGNKQKLQKERYTTLFKWADVIAGDFHYIKKYMPKDLRDKVIITNTVTNKDVEDLKERGLSVLVTTTPELNGRSFGTNVMEGVLLALMGVKELSENQYLEALDKVNFLPRIVNLQEGTGRREKSNG